MSIYFFPIIKIHPYVQAFEVVDHDLQWDFSSERSDQGDLFEQALYLEQNTLWEIDFSRAE